jgi:hypothetical protein
VVWQDRTAPPGNSQIVAYNLATGTTTPLTTDLTADNLQPAVSPDGTVVTWVACQPPNDTGCDLYDAVLANGTWAVHQLSSDGNDSHPDTNESIVVYASGVIGSGSHIYIQPVAGGTPQEIAADQPVSQANPSISGNYISYDNIDATGNSDLYVAELRNGSPDGNLYQITNTPQPESQDDISVTTSGQVNVTWQVFEGGQYDVYAFSFTPARPMPQSLCLQTIQDVQGSSKYMALPQWLRRAIDSQVNTICSGLDAVTANLTPRQKSLAIAAYKHAVAQLAQLGWLSTAQASDLTAQADLL